MWLNQEKVMNIEFNTEIFGKEFIYFDSLSSTNDYLKNNIENFQHGTVIFTANQTNGHGSKNRSWSAFAEKSISISILIKNIFVKFLRIIPIMLAVSIVQTLDTVGAENSKIKWFNDIIIGGKKVSGLLCESVVLNEMCDVILGVGINVNVSNDCFAKLNLKNAGSLLSQTGKHFEIKQIVEKLVENVENNFKSFLTNKLDYVENKFICEYTNRCLNIGNSVKIYKDNEIIIAKAVGISNDGGLVCEKDNVKFIVHNQQVSVRGFENYV